jgi:hypothetical protein
LHQLGGAEAAAEVSPFASNAFEIPRDREQAPLHDDSQKLLAPLAAQLTFWTRLCMKSGAADFPPAARFLEGAMSLGLILIILVIIYLLGGFSGRFGGYGYGMGHSGMGIGGVILVVLLVLLLLGKL